MKDNAIVTNGRIHDNAVIKDRAEVEYSEVMAHAVVKDNAKIGNGILFSGGRITIEKIRLSSYYQPLGFYCSHDVSVIYNEHLNEYNAQFIANIIMRNGSKYSYGRQAQLNVVKREVIMLPVTDDGQPDYDFMEEAGKKMMLNKYEQYLRFLSNQENV